MASRLMLSVRAGSFCGSFGSSSGLSRILATPFPLQRRLYESAAPTEGGSGEKTKNEEAKAAQRPSFFSLPRMNTSANNEGSSNVNADNSSNNNNNNSVFPPIPRPPVEIFGRKITFTYGHGLSGFAAVMLVFFGGFAFANIWFRLFFIALLAVGILL